jgi:hypothetical protein
MAAPHVAGAAAALIRATGGDGEYVTDLLLSSAHDAGTEGLDPRYGHGTLDLAGALYREYQGHRGVLFVFGALLGLLLAGLGRLSPAGRLASAVLSALFCGGIFFLPLLSTGPSGWVTDLTSSGIVMWPSVPLSVDWVWFPLWASALIPVALVDLFAFDRRLAPLLIAVCLGFGLFLVHAAVVDLNEPWWMPGLVGDLWLWVNGLLAIAAGLTVSGVQRSVSRRQES